MSIAVIGATGTVGSHVTTKLKAAAGDIVGITRSAGIDVSTADGLPEALRQADVVIDVSNPMPSDDSTTVQDAFATATRNVVDECATERVRLVFLSIVGVEDPAFDDFPHYAAKRAQEQIVQDANVQSTIVKSTQFAEFAGGPPAVTVQHDEVSVQDWLIQPIAAVGVAKMLVDTATVERHAPTQVIGGLERVRLPELVTKLLHSQGDSRQDRTVPAELSAFGDGTLLTPEHAELVGPSIDDWLDTSDARKVWQQLASG